MKNVSLKFKKFLIRRYKKYCGLFCFYCPIFRLYRKTFRFRNNKYKYFYNSYNTTWNNERTIEVPIIWEIVKKYQDKNILEIGNVLSHYYDVKHDILDKYEKVGHVINEDVVDYHPSKKYDLIVSISTLEHVGWDENLKDSKKIIQAIENLKSCLMPGGKLICTLPLGYHPEVDRISKIDSSVFNDKYYLKRISKSNKWKEVNYKEICIAEYSHPFEFANGVAVCFYRDLS